VVVGDGPERAALVRLTAGLECATAVRFAGLCVDASARLAAFDVVCLSSDTESMPNVLMEAAAAGVPVVATAVGGVAEVVHHGETGYLVSPGNAVAMAERIVQLVTNQPERARMGAAARALACKEFGTSRMVREYERLYATVARPEDRPTVSAA
jgi:glycosyltransferase involved in cell wall biosynthesis